MLTKFKTGDGFAYINPDQVFELRKYGDEKTALWPGGDASNYVIVNEPIDRVSMQLNDAMRR